MKRNGLCFTTFISVVFGLWTVSTFGQSFPERPTVYLTKGSINDIAYSPDGKLLAVAGSLGVFLYDAGSLTEVGLLPAEKFTVSAITFAPDGKILASGGEVFLSESGPEASIRLWDVQTQAELGRLEGHHTLGGISLAFSVNGKILASRGPDGVRLWDIEAQQQVALFERPEGSSISSIAFSPDGKLLAVGSLIFRPQQGLISFWNVETQQPVGQIEAHKGNVSAIIFSPDGKTLTSAGSNDLVIRLWDVETQQELGVLKGHKGKVSSLAFKPDGKILASGGRFTELNENTGEWESMGEVWLWDMEMQQQVAMLQEHYTDNRVSALTFSPDGKNLAVVGSGGKDNSEDTVRLWDVQTLNQVALLQEHHTDDRLSSLAFSPDGKLLASAGDGEIIRLWDVATQQQMGLLNLGISSELAPLLMSPEVYSLAFSPDGELLASADNTRAVRLWDVQMQQQVGVLNGDIRWLSSLAFSPDGKLLASSSDDGVILWDVEAQEPVGLLEGAGDVLAFNPDGKILISEGDDGVILWDVEAQEPVGLLEGAGGILALSPDGKILISGGDNDVTLWDVSSQQQVDTFVFEGHTWGVGSLAFSANGKWLASGGAIGPDPYISDPTIRLWDVATQQQVGLLRGHTWGVSSLAFSADGKWLASAGLSGAILLWGMSPIPPLSGTSGDVNGDGVVNLFDLEQIASQFGQVGANLSGDVNGDGTVNILDLVIVGLHFGDNSVENHTR
ncbi:hypothetical protein H8E77_12245 [bacterium]|nr:hypothetical protein [bacterium]